ncbi:hypothetical protein EDB80DRAFT_693943 [Ilyonectria destructans]|nr:hypothetical protein EDB80DRAFT_693943 [Ilyonectria destructans]
MSQHNPLQPRSHDREDSALLVSRVAAGAEDDGEALAYPTQSSSGYPEHQTAFLEPADVWKEFQVHRSSAEYHLNNYLDYLARSCDVPDDSPVASQDLSTRTQPARNRNKIQMKISRDTAIRDLLAMETVLAHAKNLRKPQKPTLSPVAAIWTVACSFSAWTIPVKVAANISALGAAVGAVVCAVPVAQHWYQGRQLDDARARVQELRCTFEDNIGIVNDTSRDILKDSQYKFLRYMSSDS